jgi:hypothetical protein
MTKKSNMKNHVKTPIFKYPHITNLILFLYCGLFILSCSSPSLTSTTHYKIEFLKNSKEQFIFEEPITYIPLETNQDCLIGAVYKIILTSDYIFVFTENLLYQFDTNGKYIRRIGSEGRGPAEYGYILDASVDEGSGKIYICDNFGQKINIYNFSGEYLGIKTRSGFWKRFEVIDNMYVINPLNYSGSEPCMLKVLAQDDSTTCFKNNVLYKQQNLFLVNDVKNFQKINNELIFHQQFNDTIYRFDSENRKLSVSYYFDFGNLKLPLDLLGSSISFNNESSNYGYLYDVCESNSYVFATIFYKGKYEKYVIDKKTGKSYSVDKKQDLIWPQWSNERGVLVSFLQANNLIKHKDEILDIKLKSVVSKMKEEDNPLIVLIK